MKSFLQDSIICLFHTQEAQELFPHVRKKNRSYLTDPLEDQPLQDSHKWLRSCRDEEKLLILAWLSYLSKFFPRQLERGFLELFMRLPEGQPEFSVPTVLCSSTLTRATIPYVAATELCTHTEHLGCANYSARCWGGESRFRKM